MERAGWPRAVLALGVFAALGSAACASNDGTPPGTRDAGREGGAMDASSEAGAPDAGSDAGWDGATPLVRQVCERCTDDVECGPRARCANLSVGGRACVPTCNPDLPSCPRNFNCVMDFTTGADVPVCVPIGGVCCIDEDGDSYGQGVGCVGLDCNDGDPAISAGAVETCDGVDQDCDGIADDPPTDCMSGRCAARPDGTYFAVSGATCMDAECRAGTTTECLLYRCEGGSTGRRCGTACDGTGMDDDGMCIATAHCDMGTCVPDRANGASCDEDGDCTSAHCENGFCCDSGRCCATATDCSGGGTMAAVCSDPSMCQGTRGDVACTDNRCVVMTGVPDDSGCDPSVRALDCGVYLPVYCTGATDQPAPRCPTRCTTDAECITTGHCEGSVCAPDRGPGGACGRPADCQDGLFCVDGLCCDTPCTGTCQSCALAGSRGTCSAVPAGTDPDAECRGFSCSDFYGPFDGLGRCFPHQAVSDDLSTCNGGGACVSASTLCPSQPLSAMVQIDCDDVCQAPVPGTCVGNTPGACSPVDRGTIMCGTGACTRSVPRCVAGVEQSCAPGGGVPELCNNVDDDCDGTVDDGPASALCPPPGGVAATSCLAGGTCSIASCVATFHDVDTTYVNGCECQDTGGPGLCGMATSLGSVGTTSSAVTPIGSIPLEGVSDWYTVAFPMDGPDTYGGGVPRIVFSINDGGAFRFEVQADGCAGVLGCMVGSGSATGLTDWSFEDSGAVGYYSRAVVWPSPIFIRVYRTTAGTSCAHYQLSITR